MKHRDLINELRRLGFKLERNGGEHDLYTKEKVTVEVPRHREINEITAKKILKQARAK